MPPPDPSARCRRPPDSSCSPWTRSSIFWRLCRSTLSSSPPGREETVRSIKDRPPPAAVRSRRGLTLTAAGSSLPLPPRCLRRSRPGRQQHTARVVTCTELQPSAPGMSQKGRPANDGRAPPLHALSRCCFCCCRRPADAHRPSAAPPAHPAHTKGGREVSRTHARPLRHALCCQA